MQKPFIFFSVAPFPMCISQLKDIGRTLNRMVILNTENYTEPHHSFTPSEVLSDCFPFIAGFLHSIYTCRYRGWGKKIVFKIPRQRSDKKCSKICFSPTRHISSFCQVKHSLVHHHSNNEHLKKEESAVPWFNLKNCQILCICHRWFNIINTVNSTGAVPKTVAFD